MCHKSVLFCCALLFVTHGICTQLETGGVESDEVTLDDLPDVSLEQPNKEFEILHNELNHTSYPLFYPRTWENFKIAAMAYLDKGNSPDVVFKPCFYYPVTLLEIAVRFASNLDDWTLLKKMKEKGANFNFMSGEPTQEESILIKAKPDRSNKHAHNLIKFLLKHGADPTLQGGSKISPIHFFAEFTTFDAEILEFLLARLEGEGRDTNIKSINGNTPFLTMAHYSGSLSDWDLVLKKITILHKYGANLKAVNVEGKDALTLIDESRVDYPSLSNVKEQMKAWLSEHDVTDSNSLTP